MKLWAYGDSFTRGDELEPEVLPYRPFVNYADAWPNQLAEIWNIPVENRGLAGADNLSISLTVLADEHRWAESDRIIVGLSTPTRLPLPCAFPDIQVFKPVVAQSAPIQRWYAKRHFDQDRELQIRITRHAVDIIRLVNPRIPIYNLWANLDEFPELHNYYRNTDLFIPFHPDTHTDNGHYNQLGHRRVAEKMAGLEKPTVA